MIIGLIIFIIIIIALLTTAMEGDMQPADEGPCAPKMCRQQQRGPCSSLKPFQSKRSAGKSRFDRSAMVEVPLFGGGGGGADDGGGGGGGQHHFSYNPGQPHPFTSSHHQQRVQQQPHHHQTTATISSSQQHHSAPPQQQQHRFHCSENRPSSRAATSTSAAGSSAAGCPQRRPGSGGGERGAPRPDPGFSPGRAALVASPDCSYGISSGTRDLLSISDSKCFKQGRTAMVRKIVVICFFIIYIF